MRWVVIAVMLAAAPPAHADKKRETAVELSAGGAAVSSALVLGAFFVSRDTADYNEPMFYAGLGTSVITPSLGEIYAGDYLTWGMGIRGGAAVLAAFALALPRESVMCETVGAQDCKDLSGTTVAVLGLAAIAYIGGVAYDVSTAGEAAERYNARHGFALRVTPSVLRTPTGTVPGFYFSATY